MRRKIVKSPYLSAVLRVLLGLLFLCLVVLVFYIYYTGGWRDTLLYYRYLLNPKRLKLFVASFGPYAAPVFVLLQCMQVVIAPIPGEVTGFVGGLLFGVWKGTLLSTIGLTIGALIAFSIGRLLGASFVHRIVKQEYIDRFDDFVRHRGLYIAWLLFILPGFPKDSLCYLLDLRERDITTLSCPTCSEGFPGRLCSFSREAPFNAVATRSSPSISSAAPSLYLLSTCGGIRLSSSYRTWFTPCGKKERTRSLGPARER